VDARPPALPSGLAAATGGPAPPAAASARPGRVRHLYWTFTTSGVGTVTLTGSASGADANSGTLLVRAPARPAPLVIQAPAS